MKQQMQSLMLCGVVIMLQLLASAQPNIIRLEYYVDADPGKGNGTSIAISPAPNIVDLPVNIDITALSSGIHLAGIRSMDINGVWSHDNKWIFGKFTPIVNGVLPNITAIEYYINTDPGKGKGVPIPFTEGTDITTAPFNIDLTSFVPGVYTVGLRSKDANGVWSSDNKWLFSNRAADTLGAQPAISRVEYYIDSDPHWGNAITVPITSAHDIMDQNVNVDLTGLNGGVHNLFLRSKDTNGRWSLDNIMRFTSSGPLPVFFMDFTAKLNGDKVACKWKTSQEINADHFNVQRSIDGISFSNIGAVAAKGNRSTVSDYTFSDKTALQQNANQIFYRIQEVDKDGKFTYTHIDLVTLIGSLQLKIFPNPAKGWIFVQGYLLKEVSVIDNKGEILITKFANGVNKFEINISALSKGLYLLKITDMQGKSAAEKMIIQ